MGAGARRESRLVRQSRKEANIPDIPPQPVDYHAFGLRLHSALALPELAEAGDDGTTPDVRIDLGTLSARLPGAVDLAPMIQAAANALQIDAAFGRIRVTGGRTITVDSSRDASAQDVRLFLLGSAIGALCHQRSCLALHAAAIIVNGRAIAFAGPSGAGKSTLAVLHSLAGGGVLTDDLCVLGRDAAGAPVVYRGPQRIKLWADSAHLAGWAPPESARIADGFDKFTLPIYCTAASLPLDRLYILRPGGSCETVFRRLVGPEAAAAILAQVYRWPEAVAMGKGADVFDQCVALAAGRQIFELCYTHNARTPGELLAAVIRHLQASADT
jgi:hypothetical protein